MPELATVPPSPKILEQLLINGDLSSLNAAERLDYYAKVCESLGLNPLTKPFAYVKLNGKLVLYALRDCAEQLRKIHGISVTAMTMQTVEGVYVVSAEFRDKTGRTDQATGAVPIKGLVGEALANAFMKAETKCKRRGTLSICGMGMLDESEVDSIPNAEKEAAEKFPRLRPVETPGPEPVVIATAAEPVPTVQVALQASVPEPDEPPRLNPFYGRLREITVSEKDRENVKRWVKEIVGIDSMRDATDEQLKEAMHRLDQVERTRPKRTA